LGKILHPGHPLPVNPVLVYLKKELQHVVEVEA
jgi:hypothetical protein